MKKNKTLRFDFPRSRTHLGMPLGNGNTGVLVWGKDNTLCLTLNRGDLWDHRQGEYVMPGQTYRELANTYESHDTAGINAAFKRRKCPLDRPGKLWRPTRLPLGRIELKMKAGLSYMELDYTSGGVEVMTCKGSVMLILSRQAQQLLVRDAEELIQQIDLLPAWEWVGDELSPFNYFPPEVWQSGSVKGWFQALPDDPGANVMVAGTAYGFAVSLELSRYAVKEFAAEDFAETLRQNMRFWKNYWNKVPAISVPDDCFNCFYRFALYKFACATDPAGGVPSGLQGPWLEEYQLARWNCDYHFNVNIQQIYTLGFSLGAYEHIMPLFDMLESESFQKVMRDNARNLFGIDDGLLLTHAVDDRGQQCGGIHPGGVLDFACGGWLAQLYWLYFRYTQDKQFLRNRAYPFMCGVMRVYESALEEYDGRLSLPMSVSAEYQTAAKGHNGKTVRLNTGRDPSNQLMCIHMLTDALIEASGLLGKSPKPEWLRIKKELPPYTLCGDNGDRRIAIWDGQDLDNCHRHHSHLAGIYPFDTLSNVAEEHQAVVENSLDHWILQGMGQWSEWSYPWATIIHARQGWTESPIQLLKTWREIFVNESMATVYLPRFRGLSAHRRQDMLKPKETSEIMQLDGTMVAATALLEMLVHQRGDTVYLFPGVPDSWTEVAFEKINLPGGFSVSAKRNDFLKINSLFGGCLKVLINSKLRELEFSPGEQKEFNLSVEKALSIHDGIAQEYACS